MQSGNHFEYQDDDPSGLHTLEAIRLADHFNRWMYLDTADWMQGRILEIGSGIGNISDYYLRDKKDLTLSDIRPNYLHYLRKRFSGLADNKILQLDLVDPQFKDKFSHLKGTFDSVFALNVIEHIEDHNLALKNISYLLKQGGTFLMLVPAHSILYNRLDRELKHFRRYSLRSAKELFVRTGFKVQHSWFFNSVGIPAWIWGGLTGGKEISGGQMSFYNKLVPLVKVADRLLAKRVGLSVIIAGKIEQ
jgi:SAM-dependent methyltransferase